MAPNKHFSIIFVVIGFLVCIVVSDEVSFRLSSVEDAISKLQLHNADLLLENEHLRTDSEDFKSKLMEFEAKFDAKINEFKEKQEQFYRDNQRFQNMVTKLENSLEIKDKELEEIKRRLGDAEAEMIHFRLKLFELAQLSTQQKEVKRAENDYHLKEIRSDFNQETSEHTADPNQARLKKRRNSRIRKIFHQQQGFPDTILKSSDDCSSSASKRLLVSVSESRDKVSFSAHMGSHMTSLGNNQPFVFDVVNNNEAGAYDRQTGIFVCPVSGTYFFIAHIVSHNGDSISAELVVDSVLKARIDANAHGTNANAAGSNSLIIHCSKGSDVWIRHFGTIGTKVYGNIYSHFAGFLLWAD